MIFGKSLYRGCGGRGAVKLFGAAQRHKCLGYLRASSDLIFG